VKTYRVLLAIEVDGKIYQHGAIVELPSEIAVNYSHALIALEEKGKDDDGSHS
jgi:hypothetical protein